MNSPIEGLDESLNMIFSFSATVAAFVLGMILCLPVALLLNEFIGTDLSFSVGVIFAAITGSNIASSFWRRIPDRNTRILLVFVAVSMGWSGIFLLGYYLLYFINPVLSALTGACIATLVTYYVWEWRKQAGL